HAAARRHRVRFAALLLAAAGLLASAFASAQTLRVGMETPSQLDPAFASADSEILILANVYDYLVDIDAANDLQPGLASSWEVSNEGTTWTFELRQDAIFHSGAPLVADDVVATYDRLRDPDAGLPTGDLYANVQTVRADGDHRVVFELSEPNPFFAYDLSDNHAVIHAADADDFGSVFDGTGPFRVVDYAPEDRITLEAVHDHPFRAPGVDAIQLVFFAEQAAAVSALRGGQLDLVLRMSTPQFQSLDGVSGIERHQVATNAFDLVRLRADRAPGDDPRVMRAMKLAVDRELILEVVTEGLGTPGLDTPVGPLYDAWHRTDLTPPATDVERARELLAEAGYEDGLSLELHVPDSGDRPDLAAVLAEMLAPAGFDVTIRLQPESVYYGSDGWLEVDFGITGWGSRPVPQFYFETMVACGAVWNEAHYCDPAVDDLIALAGSTLDDDERAEAYAELQRILADEGPYLIPYFFPQFAAMSDAYQGLHLKAFPGRTDLAQVRPR
ncbi:MAG: ABC transporter substrate-binding protein, partial [Trueperaceae bacterium]